MSSAIKKVQNRVELKAENAWLKNAFRRAYEGMMEQSENAAELTRALWAAAAQNGGEIRIPETTLTSLPLNAKLRSYRDEETGDVVFLAHIAEGPTARLEGHENIADDQPQPGEAAMEMLVGAAFDAGIEAVDSE